MKREAELAEGVLSSDEMSHFSDMLKSIESESASPTTGGSVKREAEGFIAEFQKDGNPVRLRWMDPDHTRPFPESIARIVDWMQNFKFREVAPSSLLESTVCPMWLEPLQPQSAKLEHHLVNDVPLSDAAVCR